MVLEKRRKHPVHPRPKKENKAKKLNNNKIVIGYFLSIYFSKDKDIVTIR